MSRDDTAEKRVAPSAATLVAAWHGTALPMLVLRPLTSGEQRVFDFHVALENDAAQRLFDTGSIKRRLSELVPSVDGVALIAHLAHCLQAPWAESFEFAVPGEGEQRYFSIVPTPLEHEIFAVLVDVTGHRRRQTEHAQRLAEEQEVYRATFTDAPVGIAHLDEEGRFIQVNERLLQLLGFSRKELLAMSYSQLPRPDAVASELLPGGDNIKWEDRSRIERRFLRKDGEEVWTSLTVSPVRDRFGLVRRYIAIIEDVSGLARANERLEESSRSKDEFLAVLGHELRNPLAALRHASLLLTEPGDHDLSKVVSIVDRQTRHMGRLVDDLLDVGRIVRGKLDFRVEQVDMRQIVSFALDDLAAGSVPTQRFDVRLDDGPIWIHGDSARLLQAVQNLLSNAVKYTPPDGNVCVRLEVSEGQLRFSVEDDGVGLEESFAEKLFLPFEQAPQDLSRSQGGLGLGLALTSQIIKHHGGRIRAESHGRGRGAKFVIELPSGEGGEEFWEPPTQAPVRRYRFLIVEDNRDAAELLEMLLTARGHHVTLCFSGDRALETALGNIPDVIICDLGLPGLSGFEVAAQIRKRPQLDKTILLALSGYGRPDDIKRCKEAGFSAHLTKPADANQIFAELDRLLTSD